MITDELTDDEPELVLEDEQGVELSVHLIDDVELSDDDHDLPDLPDLETLTAVATVKAVTEVPDLSFESEHEQTRFNCEIDDNLAESELDTTEDTNEATSLLSDNTLHIENTSSKESSNTLPQVDDSTDDTPDDLDSLSISHIGSEPLRTHLTSVKQSQQTVSILPTDNTRLALLESAQLALNEQINELVTEMKKKHSLDTSPVQSPSKQFTTAIYYVKHENNYHLAAKWFRKAALRGHAKAQFYLGMLFCKGDGVPKSFFHAYSWFSLAACQNVEEAIHARKKLEPTLTSREIQQSLRLAADRFDQIAELN
jgi:TPR repeat protein